MMQNKNLKRLIQTRVCRVIDIMYYDLKLGMNHKYIQRLETLTIELSAAPSKAAMTPTLVRLFNQLYMAWFKYKEKAAEVLHPAALAEFKQLCRYDKDNYEQGL